MINGGRLLTFRPSAGGATPAFLFMVVAPLNHCLYYTPNGVKKSIGKVHF